MKLKGILKYGAGVAMLSLFLTVSAQNHNANPEHYYLNEDVVPSSLTILMTPPDTVSARFAYDWEQYEWG
ncbi:MAG: hypothetical protein K2J03_01885, partial [Muribaculaceae bacterium]|nr:hypothetical protein [Muribaculaceae bacterium]